MQFIASAPTLFPPEYVQEFQYCFDRAPTIPFEDIQAILRQELGKPIDSVFEFVDPTPLASASIAQVGFSVIVSYTCVKWYVNLFSLNTSVNAKHHLLIFRCMVPG